MMKMRTAKLAFILVLLGQISGAAIIEFAAEPAWDSGRWIYNYTVINDGAEPINAFTIWFDATLASAYLDQSSPQIKSDWSPGIQYGVVSKGDGFDVLTAGAGILPGQTLEGFSVSFKWIGETDPGVQSYEIYNPVTFESIPGTTIPEPSTLLLLLAGGVGVWYGRKKAPHRVR